MTDRYDHGGRRPDRRQFIALGVGAFAVAAVPLTRSRRAATVHRRAIPTMGTVAEIAVVHGDGRWAQRAIDAALEEMRRVDRTMSRHSAHSDVGRANLGAGRDGVRVAAATGRVVAQAIRWAEKSEGAFDPALGRAVELWDVAHRTEPPAPSETRRFAGRSLFRELDVSFAGDGAVLRFGSPDIALDLGGIAKGYAVDRAVSTLREWGVRSALVNAGGDLYALGSSAEGDPWQVGVRHPDDPSSLLTTLRVSDGALATSGDYESYFEHGGRRYHHLLDARTGAPRRGAQRTITVAAADCMTADAAATAVFGADTPDAERMLRRAAPDARILHVG